MHWWIPQRCEHNVFHLKPSPPSICLSICSNKGPQNWQIDILTYWRHEPSSLFMCCVVFIVYCAFVKLVSSQVCFLEVYFSDWHIDLLEAQALFPFHVLCIMFFQRCIFQNAFFAHLSKIYFHKCVSLKVYFSQLYFWHIDLLEARALLISCGSVQLTFRFIWKRACNAQGIKDAYVKIEI